ncbi:MAG: signal peptidase II [Parcubacteria group bacterium]|jgi:signal peptidase II
MQWHRFRSFFCGIGVLFFLVIVDQVIKVFVVGRVAYLCNRGVAFSVQLPQIFFIILWLVIIVALSMYWRTMMKARFIIQIAFVLIFAGAIGNVIDRIRYGCVIDYMPFLNISSFNFADALITVGAGFLLWQTMRKS